MTVMERPLWAKLAYDDAGQVRAALPLVDHCLDVAAVFVALLRGGAWGRMLAHAAGRELTGQDVARLTVLAALHDIGKANRGFQARIERGAPIVGHEGEVAALLFDPALRAMAAGQALLEMALGWGAGAYLPALMAHHGRPRAEFFWVKDGSKPWSKSIGHWQARNGNDPSADAARVIAAIRERYPSAWETGVPLPQGERFVALFAGLLVLADWLGSDTRRFPVEGPHGGLREAMRDAAAADVVAVRGLVPVATPDCDFARAFDLKEPRGVQHHATGDLGSVALIEAETGSGKTEAALWRWLDLRRRGEVDGLYFALPTRSAAVQLHGRVEAMLRRVWGDDGPRAVLAVPGYWRVGDAEGLPLPGRRVRWDDEGAAFDARWAAEHANQYLAARVAVGTIDQALLAALKVRHAPFRAAALTRNLLVVDEVHASDAYMTGLLEQLLANHRAAGGRALLLSATLGAATRARLLGQAVPSLAEAVALPYPALAGSDAPLRGVVASGADKRVAIENAGLIDDPEGIAARAVAAARAGASVLVIRNSVAGAVAVAQAVEALAPDLAFRVGGVVTVHHGRFAASDRRLLDAEVEATFGKARSSAGRILIGTQTLEQSLDIDADLLLTDLAPMDVLLQRIGRLHRHAGRARGAFGEARVVVLHFAGRDLTPLLHPGRNRHGLGVTPHGAGPYPDVLQLEATLRLLEANPAVHIPADNRRLVEGALHPDALAAIATEGGAAWRNHAADRGGKVHADRGTAQTLALDLATPFNALSFPVDELAVTTRLGARDLLVELPEAIEGPFAQAVARFRIPAWMLGKVTAQDQPTAAVRAGEGWRFGLGDRVYRYDRWGLALAE
jgi:CRISPR-associated endonuclease/helicase Cas3